MYKKKKKKVKSKHEESQTRIHEVSHNYKKIQTKKRIEREEKKVRDKKKKE